MYDIAQGSRLILCPASCAPLDKLTAWTVVLLVPACLIEVRLASRWSKPMLPDTPSDAFVPDSRKDTVKAYTHWPPLRAASGFMPLATGLRSGKCRCIHLRDGRAHTRSAYEHPVLGVSGVPSARGPLTAGPRPETGTDFSDLSLFLDFWLCLFDIFRCLSQR